MRTCGEEGRLEEAGKMEVDEEVDSKKRLNQKKKDLQKQVRDLEKVTCMPQEQAQRNVAAGATRYRAKAE